MTISGFNTDPLGNTLSPPTVAIHYRLGKLASGARQRITQLTIVNRVNVSTFKPQVTVSMQAGLEEARTGKSRDLEGRRRPDQNKQTVGWKSSQVNFICIPHLNTTGFLTAEVNTLIHILDKKKEIKQMNIVNYSSSNTELSILDDTPLIVKKI